MHNKAHCYWYYYAAWVQSYTDVVHSAQYPRIAKKLFSPKNLGQFCIRRPVLLEETILLEKVFSLQLSNNISVVGRNPTSWVKLFLWNRKFLLKNFLVGKTFLEEDELSDKESFSNQRILSLETVSQWEKLIHQKKHF